MTKQDQFGRDTLPEKPRAARVIWADGFEKDYPNVRVAWGDVQRHDSEHRFHTGTFEHIWTNADGTRWIAQPIMDSKDRERFVGLLVTFEPRRMERLGADER